MTGIYTPFLVRLGKKIWQRVNASGWAVGKWTADPRHHRTVLMIAPIDGGSFASFRRSRHRITTA
jgi:hypothetical protein